MQPLGRNERAVERHPMVRLDALRRFACACGAALTAVSLLAAGASADHLDSGPITTGASNGGIASASSGGNVNIGEIITGENTGNSISTGDIGGVADISGGEINYPTEVNVTLNVGPPIASADGGDGGQAAPPSGDGAQVDVDINNKDKTNNRSDARAVGEGGEGGEGGDGGDVIINDGAAVPVE